MKQQLTPTGSFWYIVMNIFSFGAPYFTKLIIMKAIIDTANLKEAK